MDKIDGKALLEQADRGQGIVYPVKPGWKKAVIFAGVLTCLLIITLPLGIYFIVAAGKNRMAITDEGFAIKWFTTKAFRWSDVEAFNPSSMHFHAGGGGLVGALAAVTAEAVVKRKTQGIKGPIQFKVKGKRGWRVIPAHVLQNSLELAQELEKRTGLQVFPSDEAKKG